MLLKNCTILAAGKEMVADILIENAKIVKIGHNLSLGKDKKGIEIDLGKKHVLPGMIDAHVHLRDPGAEHKEDFYTGSFAAAAGGITTFLDMPNTSPPTFTVEALEQKRKLAGKSVVNWGLFFGASAKDNSSEIRKAKGIAGLKIYMNATTGNLLIEDEKLLEKYFHLAAELGLIVAVHAEHEEMETAIRLAKKHKARLYICHISLGSEIDHLEEEKTEDIFAEATPHHMFLSELDDIDTFTKMKPSLKSVTDQEMLLEAVEKGLIDTVGTDHAPHTIGEKLEENFPHGVPGLETMMPLLLDASTKGYLSLGKIIRLCSENPARIFKLKGKGKIAPGYDADLTVVDMSLARIVDEDMLFTRCGWSPFKEKELKGWPVMTIVGGNIVFDDIFNDRKIFDKAKGKEVVIDG